MVFDFDVATVVEDDVVGGEMAGFDLIGLEFAAGIDDGIQKVPDLWLKGQILRILRTFRTVFCVR